MSCVLGGHWGDSGVHLLATEGFFINTPANAFFAENIAAESALSFLHSLSSQIRASYTPPLCSFTGCTIEGPGMDWNVHLA